MSERAIHPVYVDGPLKGQDFPVPAASRHVQAVDPEGWRGRRDSPDVTADIATYTLRRFAFRSGDGAVTLWVGCSEPGEPDAELLADLLLSDAAKAARCD